MKFRSDLSMTYEECCITLLEGLELSAYFCGPSFFFIWQKMGQNGTFSPSYLRVFQAPQNNQYAV